MYSHVPERLGIYWVAVPHEVCLSICCRELFTIVIDMLATLIHSTLVSDSQSEKEENRKHYQNLMKKLKKVRNFHIRNAVAMWCRWSVAREFWCAHSCECDGCCHLLCAALQSGREVPVFQRNLLSILTLLYCFSYETVWWRQRLLVPPKHCHLPTEVPSSGTTRRYIPEDSTLHNHRCENLKSYMLLTVMRTKNLRNKVVVVLVCLATGP
jgi:hypothetical protein